ncbi:phage protein GemA/Gp16 family protein [Rhodocyclus gracilis]|uniref:DUF1018 domain-containing protein n=1 Tax=Rhodocyclus tenuis TaxID=1066 RepID=A0A6L5JVY5_RHOTE|nr:phage protein GemA/Gp16 family protein [Rhodocyclus gracilis]MQY50774.1 DUF1018 domain-containing protein [Rhodocyclus gracilis]
MKTSIWNRRRSAEQQRAAEITQIHVARQQTGMAEDTYRGLLASIEQVQSSKDLSALGRRQLLEHFRKLGWKPRPPKKAPAARAHKPIALSKEEIEAKIATQLKALGAEWGYAYAVGRRIFPDIARWEWLTPEQLGAVSSALERTIRFREKSAQKEQRA